MQLGFINISEIDKLELFQTFIVCIYIYTYNCFFIILFFYHQIHYWSNITYYL